MDFGDKTKRQCAGKELLISWTEAGIHIQQGRNIQGNA